ILGPLFAANVRAAAEIAREAETPLISFSTDRTAAGDGAYLLSVTPEEEVERIVDWAALKGIERFAMFGPRTTYGRRVDAALRYEATRRGAAVFASEFYDANDPSPVLPAQNLAAMVNAEAELAPGKVAVLIPERGVRLRAVAPLMPYYDVDLSIVTLLGTGLWNDPEVWREPSLFGGAFAAPDPDAIASFDETYAGEIGQEAPRLASLGYDAAALAVALGEADALSPEALERGDGFVGVNGLFRFNPDGVSEHGLAVLQVSETAGARIVDRARTSFDADGS
ncbi:MAG: penicillin-binding protein activator, partial [Pseudomonadota bacterium]